jgi:3-oxoacyl-[acyl-carrier protein] reductase
MSDERPVVMVTGGSRGIGLAISRAFGAQGWGVALVARLQVDIDAAVNSIESSCVGDGA